MRSHQAVVLVLTVVGWPDMALAAARQAPASPPITLPSVTDVVGGASNADGVIGALVTANPSTGGSGGVRPTEAGGSRPGGGSTNSGGSGRASGASGPVIDYDPLYFERRGDASFSGEGCGAGADSDGGNCVGDEAPASPSSPTTTTPARPAAASSAPQPPTRDQLIAAARRTLPLPGVQTSPPVGRDQLVNLPTWMWVDNWAPVVGTAISPALSVTVTARPRNVYWRMGDGSADKVCGPGTPWNPALREEQQRSDCTHTYRRSSASEPGLRFTAVASMTWEVTWTASNGESGSLGPSVRNQTFPMRVAEGQAVLTSSAG